jgi:hypothetical protein
MGSIPFSEITRDLFDGVPDAQTFGVRCIDTPVSLMRTELLGNGRLHFAGLEYSPAVHRQEPRSEQWKDVGGKRYSAYWWHETVRVGQKLGVEPGDQLVLAYYPNTLSQHPIPATVDTVPFKKFNNNRKSRGPHALDREFDSEEEFLTWIESTQLDFFQQSKYLVARVARPTPVRFDIAKHVATHAPKLVFGLITQPETAESLIQKIYEETELQAALHELGGVIQNPDEDTIKRAIRIALAGPFRDPSQWYGRPVCELAIDVIRRLCRHATSCEASSSFADVSSSPTEEVPFFWTRDLGIHQLHLELRAEEVAFKDMEARKDFLELQVRRLTESIAAIESLLGHDTTP